jgi:hydroxymethylpyrimidine/phosphomethylpyrimidine kinase
VTPNLPEARRMTGLPVETPEERLAAALRLAELGPAVLLKGGHGEGDVVEDLLVAGGEVVGRYRNPRIETRSTHGTGCTLSSAIAARLGTGEALPDAVEGAIAYLRGAMAAARPMGRDPRPGENPGHGPVDPLYRLFPASSEDA